MKKIKLIFIFTVVLVYFFGQYLYNTDIVNNYAYQGFEKINFDLLNFIILIFVSLFVPIKIDKPSDSFLIFYFLVILSCLVFTQPLVNYDISIKIKYIFFIIFPFFFVVFITKFKFKFIPTPFNLNITQFNILITILLIASFATIINYALRFGGFGFENLYDRRIEGRVLSGKFTGYIFGFVSNILLAYVSFNFGFKKKILYLIVSFSIVLLTFYALGMKSPVLILLLFSYLGYSQSKKLVFSLIMTCGILMLILLSIVEYNINGISLLNLFTVRRMFVVQAEVTQFYFNFFTKTSSINEVLLGVNFPDYYSDLTYYIGDKYLNNYQTNVDTNTFIFFLTKYGLIGYIICCSFVAIFLKYFDEYYLITKGSYLILTASVFSYLIMEQSFTVTLVTSGVALFSILIILLYDGYKQKQF